MPLNFTMITNNFTKRTQTMENGEVYMENYAIIATQCCTYWTLFRKNLGNLFMLVCEPLKAWIVLLASWVYDQKWIADLLFLVRKFYKNRDSCKNFWNLVSCTLDIEPHWTFNKIGVTGFFSELEKIT